MKLSKLALGASIAATALVGSVVTATPASAASYNGACGSGYKVVNSAAVGTAGTVFLTYNGSNGYNCVVTVRNKKGSAILMGAAVRRSTTDADFGKYDYGYYTSFAGPVYMYGKGSCMTWEGSIGSKTVKKTRTNCG